MIGNSINSMIEVGRPIYKISSQKKTCKIAYVVGKLGTRYGNMLLVRFENGNAEYVSYLNGLENRGNEDPGWYFIT